MIDLCDLVGAGLGTGCSRTVYEHLGDSNLVIKVPHGRQDAHDNINEYLISRYAPDHILEIIAPVIEIDRDYFITMKRTIPLARNDENTAYEFWKACDRAFVIDVGAKNIGRYDGRLVLHDYGIITTKMRWFVYHKINNYSYERVKRMWENRAKYYDYHEFESAWDNIITNVKEGKI